MGPIRAGGPGDGARRHEGDAGGTRERDGLAAGGSSFRNDVTMMTNELTSVAAECNNVVRVLGGKQDYLVDKVLSLRNDATELADELARVAERPGWGARRREGNAGGPREEARRSRGHRR
jgi:hypothetical protein